MARPRKYATAAERQRAYRERRESVTKPHFVTRDDQLLSKQANFSLRVGIYLDGVLVGLGRVKNREWSGFTDERSSARPDRQEKKPDHGFSLAVDV